MKKDIVDAMERIVSTTDKSATTAEIIANLKSNDIKSAVLDTASLVESMASAMGKSFPGIGSSISLLSLSINLDNIVNGATQDGQIQKANVLEAAADVTALFSGGSFFIAAEIAIAGGVGAPFVAVIGSALVVTSAVLTIASIASGDEVWYTPEIKQMWGATNAFMAKAGQTISSVVDAMLDPAFWNTFAQQGEAFLEPLLDPLSDLGRWAGGTLYDLKQDIDPTTHTAFQNALNFVFRRDPLVLDLDGDGIETTPADGNVLFDHNANGQKTATGWIAPDDGLLVLDRNGNGTIDTGRELFGDNTLKSDGTLAQNGFDALADLDTNQDGLIDSNDNDFSKLRVWQDLNQDGESQSNELKTLDQLNIKNIKLANQNVLENIGNNNQAIARGSFTFKDGHTSTAGAAASLNLSVNNFHREFTDTLAIPEALQGLPDMQGSGDVRDLKENSSRQREESYQQAA